MKHCAVSDRLGALLVELGEKYEFLSWVEAGKLFQKSGDIIQSMTDMIVEYLLGNISNLDELPDMISKIADLEEAAYRKIEELDM